MASYFPFKICLNVSQYSDNKFHIMFILPASSVGIGVPNILSSSSHRLILSFILLIIPGKFSRIILNNIFVNFCIRTSLPKHEEGKCLYTG